MFKLCYTYLTYKTLTKIMVLWLIMLQFPLGMLVDADVAPGYLDGLQQPFICQGKSCGCQTAEQCWTKCCCTTHAERVAWANKHGYSVPEYAKQPVITALATKSAKKSCCQTESSCCDHKPEPKAKTQRDKSPHLVWSDVQRCQGKVSSWTLLGNVIFCLPSALKFVVQSGQECFYLVDECCEASTVLPELPPPKLIAG
jgi:hypothetical protein